jgi:hypothetical protein
MALAAALLTGGCMRPVDGVPFTLMDSGTGDTDADADVDTDADADTDCDSDADAGADAGPVWRFAVFGDSRGTASGGGGHNAEVLGAIAAAALADDVDLVLYPGDLVYGSSDPATLEAELLAWRDTMEILYGAGVGVYPVRGNHDDGAFEPWNEVFSGPYAISDAGPEGEINKTYAVRHENALFLGLDEYVTIHRINQEWLDEQLAATTARHIFAFGHEPAYGAYHPDCLDDYPAERDAFVRSLVEAGGRTYFCGHDHFYARARVELDPDAPPFYQLIIATAGGPPYTFDHDYGGDTGDASVIDEYSDTPYGYLLVEVSGPDVALTWKKMVSETEFVPTETFYYTEGD